MNGYKTYIVGVSMIVYAIGGAILGHVAVDDAIGIVLEGLALMGLRHAVSKR